MRVNQEIMAKLAIYQTINMFETNVQRQPLSCTFTENGGSVG